MIAVFDSGLGGLTAMKELCSLMPDEDIVYFGDTSRIPYGTRSADTIVRYARQDLRFLSQFDIRAALVACGTISSVALDKIKDEYPFPVFGVIDSAAKAAAEATKNGRVAILGTPATVRSGAYSRALPENIDRISVACPLFVPLVENGNLEGAVTDEAVKLYLTKVRDYGADTVILGCTHYPLLANAIAKFLPGVTLINSGREAAKAIANALPPASGGGTRRYFVSDSTEGFSAVGGIFMQHSIDGEVTQIDIEKY